MCASLAWAAGGAIRLEQASVRLQGDQWQAEAQYQIKLPAKALEVVQRGTPLTFIQFFEADRKHAWWRPDENLVARQRTRQLSYFGLTQQYRIHEGNQLLRATASLDEALRVLGDFASWPVAEQKTFENGNFALRVRLRLDPTQLPQTQQISALFGGPLNLDSEWHGWSVTR